MSAQLDRSARSSGSGDDTVSVTLDLGLLWYLHEVASGHLVADCHHAEYAVVTTLLLEEAIICCEDTDVGEAAIQLRGDEAVLLLGLVRRNDKDSSGRPVGLEACRRLMRARLALERGQLPVTSDGDKSYLEAVKDGGE